MDDLVANLMDLARAAVARAQWLEALDLAAQALAADPGHRDAAAIVGTARRQLTAVSSAGELRPVTVVVVDMYRSTTIAARLGPELTRQLMLELYDLCFDAVARYEG